MAMFDDSDRNADKCPYDFVSGANDFLGGGTSSIGLVPGPTSALPPTGGTSSIGLVPGPTSALPPTGGTSSIGLVPGPTSSLPLTDVAKAYTHYSD